MKKPALTLIELLVVIGLVVVLSGMGFLAIANIRAKQSLSLSAENMETVIKRAHVYARESKDGTSWGVVGLGINSYALVSGSPLAEEKKEIYQVFSPVIIVNNDFKIWFDQGTGGTEDGVTVKMMLPAGSSIQVSVSKTGVVTMQ